MEAPPTMRPKQEENESQTTIPRLVIQRVKCGRPWCRCATTDYRRGPYQYLRWREYCRSEDGTLTCRQRKQYVRKSEVEQIQARLRQRRHRERLRKLAELEEEQARLESGLMEHPPVREYRPRRRRPGPPPPPPLAAQELSVAVGLTIPDLVALNKIRLLCPQGPWPTDGRGWRGWRYRANLVRWAGRLRDRREAGESWEEIKAAFRRAGSPGFSQ